MKKRFSKRLLVVLLCVFMVSSYSVCSFAADIYDDDDIRENVEAQFTGYSGLTSGLSITDAGKAHCTATVNGYSGYSVEITMSLQKSANGTSWTSIYSWSTSGTGSVTLSKDRYVATGYYYRTKSVFDSYNSSGKLADSVTLYSPIKSH